MRKPLLIVIMLLVTVAASVGAGELLVRATGKEPWSPVLPLGPKLPVIMEPDPELGWRNKPGRWVWPGRGHDLGRDIVMTFWPGGLRATAPERVDRDRQVWTLGGSFTQGWAVTDEETWPWRLQEAFPEHTVLNFGTAGYGTYQSLLALERALAAAETGPELVIYGFNDFHENRNVAAGSWLRSVSSTSRAGRLAIPFATLAPDGSLERHAPELVPNWPFRRRLALVTFLEATWTDHRTRDRTAKSVRVTEALVSELDVVSRSHQARLLAVSLSRFRPGAHLQYAEAFRRQGIQLVNCEPPDFRAKHTKVPGYGHPGRDNNRAWADCIAEQLRTRGLNRRGR